MLSGPTNLFEWYVRRYCSSKVHPSAALTECLPQSIEAAKSANKKSVDIFPKSRDWILRLISLPISRWLGL